MIHKVKVLGCSTKLKVLGQMLNKVEGTWTNDPESKGPWTDDPHRVKGTWTNAEQILKFLDKCSTKLKKLGQMFHKI